MSLWEPPLAIRLAALQCCANNRPALALALALALPGVALGQLTTGTVEGFLRTADGRAAAGAPIEVIGAAGFHRTVRTSAEGTFTLILPYGHYRISGRSVFVAPLQNTRINLVTDTPGISE